MANDKRRTGWRWVDEEGRWEDVVEGGSNDGDETSKQNNDQNNEKVQGEVRWESIDLDDLDEVLASLNKNVSGSKEDWDKSVKDWEEMINGARRPKEKYQLKIVAMSGSKFRSPSKWVQANPVVEKIRHCHSANSRTLSQQNIDF